MNFLFVNAFSLFANTCRREDYLIRNILLYFTLNCIYAIRIVIELFNYLHYYLNINN